eukprot:3933145-Amphidinium_carterae.1
MSKYTQKEGFQVARFSVSTDQWQSLPPLKPLGRGLAGSSSHVAVAIGLDVFVVCVAEWPGYQPHCLARFDAWKGFWEFLDSPILYRGGSHRSRDLMQPGPVIVHRGSILMAGGSWAQHETYPCAYCRQNEVTVAKWAPTGGNGWECLPVLPVPRVSRLVSAAKNLYSLSTTEHCFDGCSRSATMSFSFERWDSAAQRWIALQPLQNDELISTCRNGRIHSLGNHIMAIHLDDREACGRAQRTRQAWIYDTQSNDWSR